MPTNRALVFDPLLARRCALRELGEAEIHGPVASYMVELWLHAAHALIGAGNRQFGMGDRKSVV